MNKQLKDSYLKIVFSSSRTMAFVFGMIMGIIMFNSLYGTKVLNFTNVDWLMNSGDLTQHYIGWTYFRNDPWSFPLGLIKSFGYPYGVSVTFTDSIPLFAIFFKLLNYYLPQKFQYFGLWGIFCFILQGGLAAIVVHKFNKNLFVTSISSLFFILSPIMIFRMFGHSALAGHWIILLAIAIWVYRKEISNTRYEFIFWIGVSIVSILIHPYFIVMIFVLMTGYLINEYIENKKLIRICTLLITSLFCTILAFWVIGGLLPGTGVSASGLGLYSMNINALFNPNGNPNGDPSAWSKILKDLPYATGGQYEGFQYLGFGVILILIINLYLFIASNQKLKLKKTIPITFVVIALFLLSVSTKITFNNIILLEYPVPNFVNSLWSIFRATGRLFWPVYYIIVFWSIIGIARSNISTKKILLVLTTLLFIQYIDLSGILKNKSDYFKSNLVYSSPLKSNFWGEAGKKLSHIIFYPPDHGDYDHFSWYAVNHRMTLNTGYFARGPYNSINSLAQEKLSNLQKGQIEKDSLYIIKENKIFVDLLSNCSKGSYVCTKVDGYNVIFPKDTINIKEMGDIRSFAGVKIEFSDYLTHLKQLDYGNLVIVSAKDEASSVPEKNIKDLNELGFHVNLRGKFRWSYIGVVSSVDKIVFHEETSSKSLEYSIPSNTLVKNSDQIREKILIKSAGFESGNVSNVIIQEKEYSLNSRGLNFVVYDFINNKVVEVANFDFLSQTEGIYQILDSRE